MSETVTKKPPLRSKEALHAREARIKRRLNKGNDKLFNRIFEEREDAVRAAGEATELAQRLNAQIERLPADQAAFNSALAELEKQIEEATAEILRLRDGLAITEAKIDDIVAERVAEQLAEKAKAVSEALKVSE